MITDKDVAKLKKTFVTKEAFEDHVGSTKREFDNLYARLDHLEVRFDTLEKRFDALEEKIDRKFDLLLDAVHSIAQRLDQHETWIRHIAGESHIQLPEIS